MVHAVNFAEVQASGVGQENDGQHKPNNACKAAQEMLF